MSAPIVITVAPISGHGRFSASVDGRLLVKSSRTPFLDAARVLFAEGLDPETILVMRHHGSTVNALRARLGVAAGLTIREDNGPAQFKRYSPYGLRTGAPQTAMDDAAGPGHREAAE